jgi:putative endonuclease
MPDLAQRDKTTAQFMYYVYFLKSSVNQDLYVGSTSDVERRLVAHNSGKVKSTKGYRPWKLLGFEECQSRSDAVRKEKFFKSHQQKELLKKKYGMVAKW